MWEFNFCNYWCKKLCAEGGGLEEVGWLALSKPAFTEARSWELKWDQCCRSYLDSNYCHFWSIGSSPHRQTGALPLIDDHTHRTAHTLRNTTINTLSLFLFFLLSRVQTHTHGCKTIQMSLINAHSAWEQDLHYFMLCSFNWLQDKMISEGIFLVVVIFLLPRTQPPGIHLQGEAFVLGCVFLWSWPYSWNT